MVVLPKNFPEYCAMHRILSEKVLRLKQKDVTGREEKAEVQSSISSYEAEIKRIERMFPDNFFDRDSQDR